MGFALKHRRRQIVLYLGETSNNVFVVKEGVVRAYSILDNGNEVIVALFGPGDSFPSRTDAGSPPTALFYYDMLTDGELERIDIDDFYNNPENIKHISEYIDKRYVGALLHINALAQSTASSKVAHTLRYLTLRFGVALGNNLGTSSIYTRINLKLTQQDMADLCNMSRETANIEINKLKDEDVIVERKKYYSVNLKKLNKVIGDNLAESVSLGD